MQTGPLKKIFAFSFWLVIFLVLISASNYFLNKDLYYQTYDLKILILGNLAALVFLALIAAYSKNQDKWWLKTLVYGVIVAFVFIAATEIVTVKFANQGFFQHDIHAL